MRTPAKEYTKAIPKTYASASRLARPLEIALPPCVPKMTLERIGSIGKTQGVKAKASPKTKKARNK
jgi:hypothetical protein